MSLLHHMRLKSFQIKRHHPRSRKKVKLRLESRFHAVKKLAELIFSTENIHSWEVIYPLVVFNRLKSFEVSLASAIHPENVKMVVINIKAWFLRVLNYTRNTFHSQLWPLLIPKVLITYEKVKVVFRYCPQNRVSCHAHINHQLFRLYFQVFCQFYLGLADLVQALRSQLNFLGNTDDFEFPFLWLPVRAYLHIAPC